MWPRKPEGPPASIAQRPTESPGEDASPRKCFGTCSEDARVFLRKGYNPIWETVSKDQVLSKRPQHPFRELKVGVYPTTDPKNLSCRAGEPRSAFDLANFFSKPKTEVQLTVSRIFSPPRGSPLLLSKELSVRAWTTLTIP